MADFSRNGFLNSLPPADYKLLGSHVSVVTLEHGKQLQEQHHRVEYVYFPLSGIISLLTVLKNGAALESAMISASGALGVAAGLGRPLAVNRSVVQAPGGALWISAAYFLRAARQSPTLVTQIGIHQHNLLAQAQQTAACNCVHTAEQRLARWLLQAQDQLGDDEIIPFTQEFLSSILGVRRSTVTIIAASLQRAGSIRYSRGRIQIRDRAAVKRSACECYDVIRNISAESLDTAKTRKRQAR